jgi:hypothetical protein
MIKVAPGYEAMDEATQPGRPPMESQIVTRGEAPRDEADAELAAQVRDTALAWGVRGVEQAILKVEAATADARGPEVKLLGALSSAGRGWLDAVARAGARADELSSASGDALVERVRPAYRALVDSFAAFGVVCAVSRLRAVSNLMLAIDAADRLLRAAAIVDGACALDPTLRRS